MVGGGNNNSKTLPCAIIKDIDSTRVSNTNECPLGWQLFVFIIPPF